MARQLENTNELWTMEIGDVAYCHNRKGIFTRVPGGWVFVRKCYSSGPDWETETSVFIPWIAPSTEKLNVQLAQTQLSGGTDKLRGGP